MKEERVIKAYAKSIIELAEEMKLDIAEELTKLTEVINENNDLETLLFLDVFTIEEKKNVLNDVLAKMDLSPLLKNFLFYLLDEKRIGIFPQVFKEVVVIDDHKKGFLRGVIEGSEPSITDELKTRLTDYLNKEVGMRTELAYSQKEGITAGYRVTVGDLQLDASLDNQLTKLKETILD